MSETDWNAEFPEPTWRSDCGSVLLYRGDCLNILPKIPEASADCIVTDPPYGHNNNNGDLIHHWEAALGRPPEDAPRPEARPIANDGPEANDLFKDALPLMRRIIAPGCCCCCCGGGGPDPQFARWSLWMDEVFDFKQMIVWDKGPMGMGWHYRRSYVDHLDGKQVRLRQLAALLRFADELAEGPQRTTEFYRTHIGHVPESEVFHRYASCTHVAADRAHERIRLTYEMQLTEIAPDGNGDRQAPLAEFLTFVLQRVNKLDDERRYGRFYCPLLSVFKQTDVAINFSEGAVLLPFDVRFVLDDLVVPGETDLSPDTRLRDKCKAPGDLATDVLDAVRSEGSSAQ